MYLIIKLTQSSDLLDVDLILILYWAESLRAKTVLGLAENSIQIFKSLLLG